MRQHLDLRADRLWRAYSQAAIEMAQRLILMMIASLLMSGGCRAPRQALNVRDPDPSVKIPALQNAVRAGDQNAIPQMVKDLQSDDPAVRLFAIESLQRLTGHTFGYRYYDDDQHRRPAVEKWNQWLNQQGPATAPASQPVR